MASPTSSTARRPALVARLRELFGDVAGLDLAEADATAAFAELGIDSLILTQVAMQTKKRFGVVVTFRQMSETCRTFDALAAFLDEAMPADVAPPVAPVAAPVADLPAAAPVATMAVAMPQAFAPAGNFVQQVIQQQMALAALRRSWPRLRRPCRPPPCPPQRPQRFRHPRPPRLGRPPTTSPRRSCATT
jgi:acyl carrier protein